MHQHLPARCKKREYVFTARATAAAIAIAVPLTLYLGRAIDAPQIRRIFSCSPRDPRYHMLEHLSPKFKMPAMEREPRAALILNRFTRSLGIMFSTDAVASIFGLSPEQIQYKSFYECIQESCLMDAVRCMESAKANDSIAYLRFWSRDPRRPDDLEQGDSERYNSQNEEEEEEGIKAEMIKQEDDGDSMCWTGSQDDEGGASLNQSNMEDAPVTGSMEMDYMSDNRPVKVEDDVLMENSLLYQTDSSSSGTRTTSTGALSMEHSASSRSTYTASSSSTGARQDRPSPNRTQPPDYPMPSVELEAVVSCTSDGLVVVLRRARPQIPSLHRPVMSSGYRDGLFAAPWGQLPIQDSQHTFRPPLLPQFMPLRDNAKAPGGPPLDHLMKSIRDVAVFAWALVGINGNIAAHGRGQPTGEAQPPDGLPVWDPRAGQTPYRGPENRTAERRAGSHSQGGPPGPASHGGPIHYTTNYEEPTEMDPALTGLHAQTGPKQFTGVASPARHDLIEQPISRQEHEGPGNYAPITRAHSQYRER